jgi:hypothetical protein
MNYKGIQYRVVPIPNLVSWKWIIYLDARTVRTGAGFSRRSALRNAQLAIERTIAADQGVDKLSSRVVGGFADLTQRYAELQRLREQVHRLEKAPIRSTRRRNRGWQFWASYSKPSALSLCHQSARIVPPAEQPHAPPFRSAERFAAPPLPSQSDAPQLMD